MSMHLEIDASTPSPGAAVTPVPHLVVGDLTIHQAFRAPGDRREAARWFRDLAAAAGEVAVALDGQRAPTVPRPAEPVAPARAVHRLRFNTNQAAEYGGVHPTTVLRALEEGTLHGDQRKARGRWSIRRECLEAWMQNVPCPHQEGGRNAT